MAHLSQDFGLLLLVSFVEEADHLNCQVRRQTGDLAAACKANISRCCVRRDHNEDYAEAIVSTALEQSAPL